MLAGDRGLARTTRALIAVLLLGALTLVALPARAHAIGIGDVSLTSVDPSAGAHSNFTLSVSFTNASDDLKDVTVNLPTGLLGNPRAVPQCTETQLNADACPPASEVGSTTVMAQALGIPLNVPSTGTVYNVVPPSNRPARLGIVVRPVGGVLGKIVLPVDIDVRDDSDYGLVNVIKNIPNKLNGIPLTITSMSLTLDGTTPAGPFFIVNPTSCAPNSVSVTIDSYASSKPVTAKAPYRATNCDSDPYPPQQVADFDSHGIDQPTGATIGLTMPENVDGRAPSHTSKAVVRLPTGFGFNPALADGGLLLCSPAQFGKQGDDPIKCPDKSQIGTVTFDNPLLGVVSGKVYFGRTTGHPYQIYFYAQKQGVTVKLVGNVTLNDDTGQITTVLDGLPQVPYTRFLLTFFGGARGVLTTPPACGDYTSSTTATPFSTGNAVTTSLTTSFSDDGAGSCTPKEQPAVTGKMSSTKAMGSGTLSLDIRRPADSRRPKALDVVMPSGLVGKVFSVPMCPTAKALASACPSNTEIGDITAQAGSGPLPVTFKGKLYLGTGTSTSVARLWLDLPVKVGPIDLGHFVLPNYLTLGKTDGRVHVTATLPDAFQGFPLALRRLQLTIDRKGFLQNPSGCGARTFDVGITGVDGTQGAGSGPFQATQCGALKFRPSVRTSIEDPDVKAANGQPPFRTRITKPASDSALADVTLLVSAGLQPNPTSLNNGICDPGQLARDACPPDARLGTAYAVSPLLKDKLSGPVYLSNTGTPVPDEGGVGLPYVSVYLKGDGVMIRLDGELRLSPQAGRLEAHFKNLPDVPLTDFTLDFYGGRKGHIGPFTNMADLCASSFAPSDASLLAQDGARVSRQPLIDAAACRTGALVRADASGLSTAKPQVGIDVTPEPSDPHPLRRVTIVVPKGLSARTARAARGVHARMNGKLLARKHWTFAKGKLVVRAPGIGARRLRVAFTRGAVVPTDGVRRLARQAMSDLSGAQPVPLKLSVYTTAVRTGKRGKTMLKVNGRP
ncbi:MAG TPA: hypothetical protein VFG42_10680 [Baekduia sp.]|uniref:hypothetical protein n=1 Tax=Baekduia sp. TaxID=2600305 RepID=UPI002D767FB1|nr:hypothetical protein [Baekduia sp.]HET6507245.1 hypothetical protein [Baekduia sp.]